MVATSPQRLTAEQYAKYQGGEGTTFGGGEAVVKCMSMKCLLALMTILC